MRLTIAIRRCMLVVRIREKLTPITNASHFALYLASLQRVLHNADSVARERARIPILMGTPSPSILR